MRLSEITLKKEQMRYQNLKLSALFFLFSLGLNAQEVVSAAAGNSSGSGGTFSYILGQSFFATYTGITGSIAEGVQQPYEISVQMGVDQTTISLSASIYPNPTSDFLVLKVDNPDLSNLYFDLYNFNGKTIRSQKIDSNETWIDMRNLLSTSYFIRISTGTKEIKIFKIIKK